MSPTPNVRATGFPSFDAPQGQRQELVIAPLGGFTPVAMPVVDATSFASGQNVWVRNQALMARDGLVVSHIADNTFSGVTEHPLYLGASSSTSYIGGLAIYANVNTPYVPLTNPICYPYLGTLRNFHKGAFNYSTNQLSWSVMSYVSSTGSSLIPSLQGYQNWYGATVYSSSRNSNFLIIAGDNLTRRVSYAIWDDAAASITNYSHLTGAPGAVDITTFANRAVLWNCATIANSISIPQRVQWCVAGDPEDWTGLGSGSEDLVDMQGTGTRIFTNGDEMLLASDRELWRGRDIGPPYFFQFTPLTRELGIPYPRAAMKTPQGIVWLGYDYMIRAITGESIQDIGQPVQQWLRANLVNPQVCFFTYNSALQHLRFWFSTTGGSAQYPDKSITYDVANKIWTFEQYATTFQYGALLPDPAFPEVVFSSALTTLLFQRDRTSDGAASSTITTDAVLGPLDANRVPRWPSRTLRELHVESANASNSVLSISASMNLGSSYSETKSIIGSSSTVFGVSAFTFDTTGKYLNLRVQGAGGWRIARLGVVLEEPGR